ncbi:hypothetical protein DOTSEDRAFT_72225 [Dothistroma septosporum NZE10]|uniref:MICOS complex subunit MIC12 n=1 Tax=Dothistroma septosporum (strain NZE10 / CBS 128990) TaxID=675120 RepID=N1PQJ2_DOTSN|nr:hypothetical protein DOTSEDRAFT_72225 [Dothistroma septosporum NZE10]
MGFTTGLLGGFTLTASLLYLSTELHSRNRIHQAALLRQQALLLNNIVNPQPELPPPTSREVKAGLWETAKDKWNAELENNVRKVQRTDWSAVGQNLEESVSGLWRRAFQSSREGAELAGEKIGEQVGLAQENIKQGVKIAVQDAEQKVKKNASYGGI